MTIHFVKSTLGQLRKSFVLRLKRDRQRRRVSIIAVAKFVRTKVTRRDGDDDAAGLFCIGGWDNRLLHLSPRLAGGTRPDRPVRQGREYRSRTDTSRCRPVYVGATHHRNRLAQRT